MIFVARRFYFILPEIIPERNNVNPVFYSGQGSILIGVLDGPE
jgi:hypothetical protein